jgi:HPr kinase/phosphorylase
LRTQIPSRFLRRHCRAPTRSLRSELYSQIAWHLLIVGDSGIGKSECALDLITRGHRLISDDSVRIREIGSKLIGEAPASIRDFIEIRGLGIINARELFGVSALAQAAEIRFCIEFSAGASSSDRLGLESDVLSLLSSDVPRHPLPVTPGRNLATLVEAAVRVFVSSQDGPRAVDKLIAEHSKAIKARQGN